MEILWCWRCKEDVPMLDEREYQQIAGVLMECLQTIKKEREDRNARLDEVDRAKLLQPVLDLYAELTGWSEVAPDAIVHHRLSLYGPPCSNCTKPLRTPLASFCAYCGFER